VGTARGDRLTLLSGTGQNVAGLAVFVAATFGTNVLISRAFGSSGASALGTVTLATQFAFIAGAAARFGMDMATVRRVAIEAGRGEPGRGRAVVVRAAGVAAVAGGIGGLAVFLGAGPLTRAFTGEGSADAFQAAALGIPFVALCQVYLGGTRGLKIMRHTLTIFWAGQPVAWILLMAAGWSVSRSTGTTVLAYSASWILATVAAWFAWERETRRFTPLPAGPHELSELMRYGAPRVPAALLSQLLFWVDYFVVSRYVSTAELGIYAAAVRIAQALMLFLIAVNYMFSPFVADLHARGERDRLDDLYKAVTRWIVAGTLPLLLLLLIAPGALLRVFGPGFEGGSDALRILALGQLVNVAVGSVGFILIMVGRTGWDLAVYGSTFALDLAVAFWLAPRWGMEGAAIAQALAMVASNGGRLYLVRRYVHIQPFDRHYLRLVIPAAAAALAMLGGHAAAGDSGWIMDLTLTGALGTLVYIAGLFLIGLTRSERRAVARILGRTQPLD
jgi:O-antigen/teichoic acid export membrane protein